MIEKRLLSKDKNTYLDMLSTGNKALAELFASKHLSQIMRCLRVINNGIMKD